MQASTQERWGVLVIRAWTDSVDGTRLTARIIATRNSHNEVAAANGVDDVVGRVRKWLEDLEQQGSHRSLSF